MLGLPSCGVVYRSLPPRPADIANDGQEQEQRLTRRCKTELPIILWTAGDEA